MLLFHGCKILASAIDERQPTGAFRMRKKSRGSTLYRRPQTPWAVSREPWHEIEQSAHLGTLAAI